MVDSVPTAMPYHGDRPLKVLCLGHSFIRRLGEYVKKPHYSDKLHQFSKTNLWLSQQEFQVIYIGYGGSTIGRNGKKPILKHLHYIGIYHTDILFVQMGSNDLCRPDCDPFQLSKDVFKICDFIRVAYETKVIVLGQILHRSGKGLPVLVPDYNQRVDATNRAVASGTRCNPHYMFCWHDKFTCTTKNVYTDDGIHLNKHTGYPKYSYSVRGAVLRARDLIVTNRW